MLKKVSSNEYAYTHKGVEYILAKYEGGSRGNGVRWSVELDGKEIAFDFTTRKNAINYIDSHK